MINVYTDSDCKVHIGSSYNSQTANNSIIFPLKNNKQLTMSIENYPFNHNELSVKYYRRIGTNS